MEDECFGRDVIGIPHLDGGGTAGIVIAVRNDINWRWSGSGMGGSERAQDPPIN